MTETIGSEEGSRQDRIDPQTVQAGNMKGLIYKALNFSMSGNGDLSRLLTGLVTLHLLYCHASDETLFFEKRSL